MRKVEVDDFEKIQGIIMMPEEYGKIWAEVKGWAKLQNQETGEILVIPHERTNIDEFIAKHQPN